MATIDASVPIALGDALGSMITSVVDAQVKSSRSSIDFINDIAGSSENNEPAQMPSIAFKYKKQDENGELADYTLAVPILSLVEVPVMGVKTAKFQLQYDVSAVETEVEETEDDSPSDTSPTPKLKGRIVKNSETKGGITIDVEVEKVAMPSGLERLLDIAEQAMILEKDEPGNSNEA